jgi:hypothetical protein
MTRLRNAAAVSGMYANPISAMTSGGGTFARSHFVLQYLIFTMNLMLGVALQLQSFLT